MNLLEIPQGTRFEFTSDSDYPQFTKGTVVERTIESALDDEGSVSFTIIHGSVIDVDDIHYGEGEFLYLDASNLGNEVN